MIDYLHKIKNIDEGMASRTPTTQRYSSDFRKLAVNKVKTSNVQSVANELNVPYKTLYGWVNTFKIGE
jgi:transposase-like protein